MNLKELLQGLLIAAESKDKAQVLELNKAFDDLVMTSIRGYNDYDNFRQSCLLGLINPNMYDMCIKDARERFARLYQENDGRFKAQFV